MSILSILPFFFCLSTFSAFSCIYMSFPANTTPRAVVLSQNIYGDDTPNDEDEVQEAAL